MHACMAMGYAPLMLSKNNAIDACLASLTVTPPKCRQGELKG